MKRVLCKVVGGPKIGMGHVYRCLGLAKILEKDFKVIFHINNDIRVKELLKEQGATYFVDEDIEKLVSEKGIDLLLFDQLSEDDGLFEALKSRFPRIKIVALDYFDYDNEFVDVIINLFNQNLQKSKASINGVKYYEGLEYAIIRDEFHRYISHERKISPKVKNILITFGGVDYKGNTKKVLQLLESEKIPDVNIDIILGPMWQEELPAFGSNIHIHHSVSNIADYMAKADLAFCGSGTTMMELLSIGTPTVVVPQNFLEERFALNVEKRDAIVVFRNERDGKNIITRLLSSYKERERLSRNSRVLIDGKGKEKIYNIIQSTLV